MLPHNPRSMSISSGVLAALLGAVSILAFTSLTPAPSRAADMSDGFVNALARTPRDSTITGLVMLREQPNVKRMQRDMAARGVESRWRQHQYVIENAQNLAARTQSDLLTTLEEWKRQGVVRSYQSFWITNLIAIEARPIAFDRLVNRPEVRRIYDNPPIELRSNEPVIVEDGSVSDPQDAAGDDALGNGTRGDGDPPVTVLPDNLICINLQSVWNMGLHGDGRVVCSFDTGVDGTHPAISSRWRGVRPNVPWWAAWHDPYTGSQFPYDVQYHGTHVTGIMVGRKPDMTPIGVAPGASWIAAGVLIGYDVQKIIDSYQWAVDPDSNPATISDVPDVINNSWGVSADCDSTFWNAIDVVEAAGIVNIIAVDNRGPNPYTVNSPESRALTPLVNFGVGNVNPHVGDYPIWTTSGRGPSPCDSVSIKPEITAPGVEILSCIPGPWYGTATGASMAAPHVSGAVAILRQLNPDITVDEVKTALMATAVDKGDLGEDNSYGWGILDVAAAVEYVRQNLPLYPPRNLETSVSTDSVSLTWTFPERINPWDRLLSYRIYRTDRDVPFSDTPIAEVPASVPFLSYLDAGVAPGSYQYVMSAVFQTGESGPSNVQIAVVLSPADVPALITGEPSSNLTAAPNPFNPVTVIQYRAPRSGGASLRIYDARGALVRSLVDSRARVAASTTSFTMQSVVWDGTDNQGRGVASGPYFVRLEADGTTAVRRIVLLK
jgi:subtilisin family serine protease